MSEPVDDIVWEDVVLDGISVIEDATDSTNKPMSTSDDNLYFVDLSNNSGNKDTNVDMGNKDMMDSMKKRGRPPKSSSKSKKTTGKQQSSSPVIRVKNRKNILSQFWLKKNKTPNSAEKSAARMNINITTADDNFSPLDVETADMRSLSSDQHSEDLDNIGDIADIDNRDDIEVKNEKQTEGDDERDPNFEQNIVQQTITSASLTGVVPVIETISVAPRKRGRPPKQAKADQSTSTISPTEQHYASTTAVENGENNSTGSVNESNVAGTTAVVQNDNTSTTTKRRGRPAGSTNKKNYSITMSNISSSPGFVNSSVIGQKRASQAPVKLMINSLHSKKSYNTTSDSANMNSKSDNAKSTTKSTAKNIAIKPSSHQHTKPSSINTNANSSKSSSATQKRKHDNDAQNNCNEVNNIGSKESEQQPKKRGRPPASATAKLFSNHTIDYEANNIFDVKCSVASDNSVVGKGAVTLTGVKRGRGRPPKPV